MLSGSWHSRSWRVTSRGIPAQTEPGAHSLPALLPAGRGAVTGRRNRSSCSGLVFAVVPPSQSRVRVKASPGPHLLEAFPWDREQGLNVAPKPQEIPPPPTSPFPVTFQAGCAQPSRGAVSSCLRAFARLFDPYGWAFPLFAPG